MRCRCLVAPRHGVLYLGFIAAIAAGRDPARIGDVAVRPVPAIRADGGIIGAVHQPAAGVVVDRIALATSARARRPRPGDDRGGEGRLPARCASASRRPRGAAHRRADCSFDPRRPPMIWRRNPERRIEMKERPSPARAPRFGRPAPLAGQAPTQRQIADWATATITAGIATAGSRRRWRPSRKSVLCERGRARFSANLWFRNPIGGARRRERALRRQSTTAPPYLIARDRFELETGA